GQAEGDARRAGGRPYVGTNSGVAGRPIARTCFQQNRTIRALLIDRTAAAIPERPAWRGTAITRPLFNDLCSNDVLSRCREGDIYGIDRSEVIKQPKFGSEPRPKQDQAIELFPDFATLQEALEAARLGIWSWDLATNTVNWSSNLAALHGLAPGSFDGSYAGFLNAINEED